MTYFIQPDQQLFLWIQHHCHNSFLDVMMPVVRSKSSWYPLYALLLVLLLVKYRWVGLRMIAVVLLCVIFSDLLGSRVVKPLFKRSRPCEESSIAIQYTPTIDCGKRGYSFTSNHASNHFALAFALCLFFYKRKKWLLIIGVFWAGIISFAQVYVGVHYPLDVLGGALIGISLSLSAHWIIKRYYAKYFSL